MLREIDVFYLFPGLSLNRTQTNNNIHIPWWRHHFWWRRSNSYLGGENSSYFGGENLSYFT